MDQQQERRNENVRERPRAVRLLCATTVLAFMRGTEVEVAEVMRPCIVRADDPARLFVASWFGDAPNRALESTSGAVGTASSLQGTKSTAN